MTAHAERIRVLLDPTNPGQFFACCGLLELADRLWPSCEGWFEGATFFVSSADAGDLPITMERLLREIAAAPLTPLDAADRGASPLHLAGPFHMTLDWWRDDRSGGKRMKTWAGQQAVLDIARGMQSAVAGYASEARSFADALHARIDTDSLPFNFDSDLGLSAGSALDVGFSFDPLKSIRVRTRPVIEWLALVGLQRFRAWTVPGQNRHLYWLWLQPLTPAVAACAACGALTDHASSLSYAFTLLYRTKYLKSFLPAQPLVR